MRAPTQRARFRRPQWARRLEALLFAAALAWPLARPGTAHAGGGGIPGTDALFHLGRCGDTPTSPACQWSCANANFQNPGCANEKCELKSSQILASLTGRVAFTVDDAACSGGPPPQTRLSLRVKPPRGADFSVPDRLLDLCNASLQCGSCDPDANCCDPSCNVNCDPGNTDCCLPGSSCNAAPGSCPIDPAFLCGIGSTPWNETVLVNGGNISLEGWLNSNQLIPPSMTADIASLPAGAVPVIVGAREISSAFVAGLPPNNGPSKREFCLNIWVITLPDPARTTISDPPGSNDNTSSLTDMGSCGCGDGLVGLGEECDDRNTTPGDGCDATCRREACWTCDVAQPGQSSSCSPTSPRTQCRRPTVPMKAVLRIKDKTRDRGDSLKWKWTKGQATADFGNPLGTDAYDLCIYQDSGSRPLLFAARAPAGGTCDGEPCWTAKGNGGFKYKNKSGVPTGLVKLALKPGADGKAKISARAKGAEVTLPLLPLPLPALAQLQRIGQPDCWEATYSSAGQIANDAARFKGKAD